MSDDLPDYPTDESTTKACIEKWRREDGEKVINKIHGSREKFIAGCVQHRVPREVAEELYEKLIMEAGIEEEKKDIARKDKYYHENLAGLWSHENEKDENQS